MKISARLLVLCVMLSSAACAAHAAPVARMSCTPINGESQAPIAFNVSYFDLGVAQTLNIGSQGSGAGAGKTTFEPLVVDTSFAPFQALYDAAVNGSAFGCTLTTTNSTGEKIEFVLNLVAVSKVDAIAQAASGDAARTAYTEVTFEYGGAQVSLSSNAADDGGTSPANDGWVKVKNPPSN